MQQYKCNDVCNIILYIICASISDARASSCLAILMINIDRTGGQLDALPAQYAAAIKCFLYARCNVEHTLRAKQTNIDHFAEQYTSSKIMFANYNSAYMETLN